LPGGIKNETKLPRIPEKKKTEGTKTRSPQKSASQKKKSKMLGQNIEGRWAGDEIGANEERWYMTARNHKDAEARRTKPNQILEGCGIAGKKSRMTGATENPGGGEST